MQVLRAVAASPHTPADAVPRRRSPSCPGQQPLPRIQAPRPENFFSNPAEDILEWKKNTEKSRYFEGQQYKDWTAPWIVNNNTLIFAFEKIQFLL